MIGTPDFNKMAKMAGPVARPGAGAPQGGPPVPRGPRAMPMPGRPPVPQRAAGPIPRPMQPGPGRAAAAATRQATAGAAPRSAAAQSPQGAAARGGMQPAQGQALARPVPFQASAPKGFTMAAGQSMWGTVADSKGGSITLQMGGGTLTTQARLPLTPGQSVLIACTTPAQGGKIGLQLLQTAVFSKVSRAELGQSLMKMNMPVNETTLNVAREMVEYRVPLTPRNVREFTRVMAELPGPPAPSNMAAAGFLKLANLPMTPANVTLLSNFIAQHPLLGSQLFEMKKGPADPEGSDREARNREMELLEEIAKTAGGYVVDPGRHNPRKLKKNLKKLAQEEGIEGITHGFGGDGMEEGWELMSLIRRLKGEPGEAGEQPPPDEPPGKNHLKEAALHETVGPAGDEIKKAMVLLKAVEENLQAQNLINSGRPQSDLAFYYMQVPMKLGEDEDTTAELRISYYEEDESKVIDPENTSIQFDVSTENLGELHLLLRIERGRADLDIGTTLEGLDEFIERFTPILRKSMGEMGYTPGTIQAFLQEEEGPRPLIQKESFETLERLDMET